MAGRCSAVWARGKWNRGEAVQTWHGISRSGAETHSRHLPGYSIPVTDSGLGRKRDASKTVRSSLYCRYSTTDFSARQVDPALWYTPEDCQWMPGASESREPARRISRCPHGRTGKCTSPSSIPNHPPCRASYATNALAKVASLRIAQLLSHCCGYHICLSRHCGEHIFLPHRCE